jgi:hypothetical protein
MRIFWWQHGLHIKPESQSEANMLVALVDSVKFGREPESPSEQAAKIVVGDPQFVPSGTELGKLNNQEAVG